VGREWKISLSFSAVPKPIPPAPPFIKDKTIFMRDEKFPHAISVEKM
jgi:hypothetical protein